MTKYRFFVFLLALSLAELLCACTPATLPTDLTAPPTVPPTTVSLEKDLFSDLGTVCDIDEYEDGILLLTHTGVYFLDKKLESCRILDDPCNKLFLEPEQGGFFDRLMFEPNYDDPYFSHFTITDKGVFFYCTATDTYYLNGEPYEFSIREQLKDGTVEPQLLSVTAHHGVLYTSWRKMGFYEEKDFYVVRENEIIEGCTGGYLSSINDKLYIHHFFLSDRENNIWQEYISELNEEGQSVKVDASTFSELLDEPFPGQTAVDGAYTYYLEYSRELVDEEKDEYIQVFSYLRRVDKEGNVEELESLQLQNEDASISSYFILDENHLIYLTYTARLEIAEFSVKQ